MYQMMSAAVLHRASTSFRSSDFSRLDRLGCLSLLVMILMITGRPPLQTEMKMAASDAETSMMCLMKVATTNSTASVAPMEAENSSSRCHRGTCRFSQITSSASGASCTFSTLVPRNLCASGRPRSISSDACTSPVVSAPRHARWAPSVWNTTNTFVALKGFFSSSVIFWQSLTRRLRNQYRSRLKPMTCSRRVRRGGRCSGWSSYTVVAARYCSRVRQSSLMRASSRRRSASRRSSGPLSSATVT
mmetsp:Transcript_33720/g.58267  ORF Transcript_33720/g.58267 Transcript_33720/m.58267 type:complete len:246 (+) Transcript_33720:1379-2116(+)